MSNEELSQRIKAGERYLLPALWEQVRSLVLLFMMHLLNAKRERAAAAGVELDDLEQEGYFALLDAVEAYDEGSGYKFSTYLKYPCQNRFNAAIGIRTRRQMKEPLSNAASLNAPAGSEDEDTEQLDLLSDPVGAAPFEDVTEQIWREQLHEALEQALDTLPEKHAYVIHARYYDGLTLKEVSEHLGCCFQWGRDIERAALRRLARSKHLQSYRDDIIAHHAYHGGLAQIRAGRGSSVERAVEHLDRAERREAQREMAYEWEKAVRERSQTADKS